MTSSRGEKNSIHTRYVVDRELRELGISRIISTDSDNDEFPKHTTSISTVNLSFKINMNDAVLLIIIPFPQNPQSHKFFKSLDCSSLQPRCHGSWPTNIASNDIL
jgi:hypothetical protein